MWPFAHNKGFVQTVLKSLGVAAWLTLALGPTPSQPAVAQPDTAIESGGEPPHAANQQQTLWVLSVGISAYPDERLKLRFAADDAKAIAEALAREDRPAAFRDVRKSALLDHQATREGILKQLDSIIADATPVDTAVLYLAGHGIQDPRSGRIYFLPFDAALNDLTAKAIPLNDLDNRVRELHQKVDTVILILDTCHAAAVDESALGVHFNQDLARQIEPTKGLFVLAAAQAGEQSQESKSFGHGAFTRALLDGLEGAAADEDGKVKVLGLAQYVQRVVPDLTNGEQHPYALTRGGNPVLTLRGQVQVAEAPVTAPADATSRGVPAKDVIAVFDFQNALHKTEYAYLSNGLAMDFAAALTVLPGVEVYTELEVQVKARHIDDNPLKAAHAAGVTKIITGRFEAYPEGFVVQAQLREVDPPRLVKAAAANDEWKNLFKRRSDLIVDLLKAGGFALTDGDITKIRELVSSQFEAFRAVAESESRTSRARSDSPAATPTERPKKKSKLAPPLAGAVIDFFAHLSFSRACFATETPVETELRSTLEAYRLAYEQKDLKKLTGFYSKDLSDAQQSALKSYFATADDLHVEFKDIRVIVAEGEATVSFTRQDRFVDPDVPDEEQKVVVRLTKLFVKKGDRWRMVPEK